MTPQTVLQNLQGFIDTLDASIDGFDTTVKDVKQMLSVTLTNAKELKKTLDKILVGHADDDPEDLDYVVRNMAMLAQQYYEHVYFHVACTAPVFKGDPKTSMLRMSLQVPHVDHVKYEWGSPGSIANARVHFSVRPVYENMALIQPEFYRDATFDKMISQFIARRMAEMFEANPDLTPDDVNPNDLVPTRREFLDLIPGLQMSDTEYSRHMDLFLSTLSVNPPGNSLVYDQLQSSYRTIVQTHSSSSVYAPGKKLLVTDDFEQALKDGKASMFSMSDFMAQNDSDKPS